MLNGTSGANKVVLNALLAPGDLVLYERNNHKSIGYGALIQAGAIPIYLETARNPFGLIGGVLDHCFNEEYIRMLIAERDPKRAMMDRPLRAAVIQLGNYDGCIYNARQVVDKIGHLCDYIFFDSAWVGYEQFIPMMKDCSPLLLNLGPEDPGIIVVQSVHKQQAGFSQASQILKKDSHIKGQKRYLPHKILNNSFMVNSSTSPNYQIFASLDMNAKMQEGESGKLLWHECIVNAIEARKSVIRHCKYLRPIVPPVVHGSKWRIVHEHLRVLINCLKFQHSGLCPPRFRHKKPFDVDIGPAGKVSARSRCCRILRAFLVQHGIVGKCDRLHRLFLSHGAK